jgi:LysM repeat protein
VTRVKIPKLFRLKRTRVRAAIADRRLRTAASAGCEDVTEPNMKLSRALLVVLLLHVVAVAGILAFNAIKTRQSSIGAISAAANPSSQTLHSKTKQVSANTASGSVAKETATQIETKSSPSVAKSTTKGKTQSGLSKTYTVVKGDNPVTIAKKFKVSYDDLLALNRIDDPRKLHIGQKLLIPIKPAKDKKTDESH